MEDQSTFSSPERDEFLSFLSGPPSPVENKNSENYVSQSCSMLSSFAHASTEDVANHDFFGSMVDSKTDEEGYLSGDSYSYNDSKLSGSLSPIRIAYKEDGSDGIDKEKYDERNSGLREDVIETNTKLHSTRSSTHEDDQNDTIIAQIKMEHDILKRGIELHKKYDPDQKYEFILPKNVRYLMNPFEQKNEFTTNGPRIQKRKRRERGKYSCSVCGKPKEKHICDSKQMRDAACQTANLKKETDKIAVNSGVGIVYVAASSSDDTKFTVV